jgi:hypothetical protein
MPRKIQTPIEFRIRALKVPLSMSPDTYLRSLLDGLRSGELPRGVGVELYWRNPETHSGRSKNWQSDDFLNAVAESNGGFASALERVIKRKLSGDEMMPPPKRMVVRKKKGKHGRVHKKQTSRTAKKRRTSVPGRAARKVAHVPSTPRNVLRHTRKPIPIATSLRTTSKAVHRIAPPSQKRDALGRFMKAAPVSKRKKTGRKK